MSEPSHSVVFVIMAVISGDWVSVWIFFFISYFPNAVISMHNFFITDENIEL